MKTAQEAKEDVEVVKEEEKKKLEEEVVKSLKMIGSFITSASNDGKSYVYIGSKRDIIQEKINEALVRLGYRVYEHKSTMFADGDGWKICW